MSVYGFYVFETKAGLIKLKSSYSIWEIILKFQRRIHSQKSIFFFKLSSDEWPKKILQVIFQSF